MKRLVLSIILLSSIYAQADWIKLGKVNDRTMFINSEVPNQTSASSYSAWTLMILPKANEDRIRAYQAYNTYDCRTGGRKLLHLTAYDNTGDIVTNFNAESMTQVEYDNPASPGYLAYKKICGR